MKTTRNRRWNLVFGSLAIIMLLTLTNSCIVDYISRYSQYIANKSGIDVTFTSNRKTVTIPNDSTVYIGASFDYLDLGAIFGDTLRVVFADSLEYTFFKYDYDTNINSRNPYKFYRWSNVQVGGGPNFIYDRTFTVDKSFRE